MTSDESHIPHLREEIRALRARISELESIQRDHERAAAALRFDRARLASIFDGIDEIIYVTDPWTYEILYVNSYLKQAFGHDPTGGRCYEAFQQLEKPCDFCTNSIILEKRGAVHRWEYHNPVLDRDFLIFDRIIDWPDARQVRFELAIDITEKRNAEKALATRLRYEKGLASCSQALAMADVGFDDAVEESLEHLMRSSQASRVYLYENFEDPKDGLCMRKLLEVSDKDKGVLLQANDPLQHLPYKKGVERWRNALSHGKPICGSVKNFPASERALLEDRDSLSILALPVFVSGRWWGLIGFDDTRQRREWSGDDVRLLRTAAEMIGACIERCQAEAKRRQMEAQLLHVQKMESIGRLAGGIAHDLNNLLTPILGSAEIATREIRQDKHLQVELEEILQAAMRAKELTRQLLAFGRNQMLQMRIVNVNKVLRRIERMLKRLLRENIQLRITTDPTIGNVKADPTQLDQILVNILVNAQDAMPDGGALTLETCNAVIDDATPGQPELPPGRYVVLAAADTGRGMDNETLSYIFEPFYTTKEKSEGTGLGLATVYGIVKQHGGYVLVDSEIGQGTTFRIFLPVAQEETAIDAAPPTEVSRSETGETVLVVEDEDSVRKLACRILEMHGYRMLSAVDGPTAVQVADGCSGSIDLLLTDVIMPEMNGKELFEVLNAKRPRMKVVYMSGYTDQIIVDHGLIDEGVHLVQKPFTIDQLTRKVREALDDRGDRAREKSAK